MLDHQYVVILMLDHFLLDVFDIFFKLTEFFLQQIGNFIELALLLNSAKGINQDFFTWQYHFSWIKIFHDEFRRPLKDPFNIQLKIDRIFIFHETDFAPLSWPTTFFQKFIISQNYGFELLF